MKMLQLTKKARFAVAYPVVALMFVFAKTDEATLGWGGILVLIGEGIRLWANGYIGHKKVNRTRKNEGESPIGTMITAGPYAYVRHPLYLGTFFIVTGICVAAGRILFAALVLAVFVWIYQRKMNEEDRLLSDEIGAGHSDYMKAVPQWIPLRIPFKKPRGIWSWQGIRASKEWKTILWIGILFIAFYLREEFYQEHELFNGADEWPKHLFFVFALFALAATDLWMTLKAKRSDAAKKSVA